MSLKSALTELLASEKKDGKEMIEHGWIGSSRFLVFVAIAALIVYLAYKGLTDLRVVIPVTALAAVYILSNTVTRIYQIKANADIIKERQRLAWADGQLTADEAAALTAADANASSAQAAVASVTKN
jgi:hypothetical protein